MDSCSPPPGGESLLEEGRRRRGGFLSFLFFFFFFWGRRFSEGATVESKEPARAGIVGQETRSQIRKQQGHTGRRDHQAHAMYIVQETSGCGQP